MNRSEVCGGRTLRIAVGITMLIFAIAMIVSVGSAQSDSIKVYRTSTDQIDVLDIESQYLPYVVASENGAAPFESMKAQAVASRTFAYYKKNHPSGTNFDVYDNESDQVYNPGIALNDNNRRSVSETNGIVLKYSGVIIAGFYVSGTGDTVQFVTYNEGKNGNDIVQSSIGLITSPPSLNPYNRGCMGQVQANELTNNGYNWQQILKYFYGEDIILEPVGRSGGPDDFGYTFKDSYTPRGPAYDWIEINSTGTSILGNRDDGYVDNIPAGFFFNFYGTDYSQLSITNNGLILPSGGTSQYSNQPIGGSAPHNFISPFWDDIVTWGSGGTYSAATQKIDSGKAKYSTPSAMSSITVPPGAIYYQTLGEAPNRIFVAEWYDNQHFSYSPSGITFEAILYEGTNNIKFQYKDVDFGQPGNNDGGSATVGIEGADGRGLQYSYDEPVINPNMAILFRFPAFSGTNMYISKSAPASMDHGNSMTYTLYFNNFGSVDASDVLLQDTLPSNVEFVSASDGGTFDSDTGMVTWNMGSVPAFPSGRGSRTVTVRIPGAVPVGTVIQNTASISTTTLETRYDDNSASASTTVTGSTLPPDVNVGPVNGNTGGTPTIYWQTPITFSYYSTCATGIAINIHIVESGSDITGSMVESSPDTWTYTTTFYPNHGQAIVTYTLSGCDTTTVGFNIYIDPAGYIYDASTGARISGASVWLQRPDGQGGWENVPTGETPAISQPDENPLITNDAGQYQWDVLAGSYRVHVEAPGYYPADSIVVSIPPPVTDLHVGLTQIPLLINIASPDNESVNNTGYVNVTVSLSSQGTAILNWQGTNESMIGQGTSFYKNKTGLLSGNYSFKVFANDSNKFNVSETRIVTVNRTKTISLLENISMSTFIINSTIVLTSPGENVTVTIFNGTNASLDGSALVSISIDSLAQINSTYVANLGSDKLIGENITLDPEGAVFNPDIQLQFNYSGSQLESAGIGSASQLRIKFYNTSTNTWDALVPYTLIQNGSDGYVIANTSHFSTYVLIGVPSPMNGNKCCSSGGGGGGGGVVTGEPFANIAKSESYDKDLVANMPVTYTFKAPELGVYEIAFTGKENELGITLRAEALKGTSKQVTAQPLGTIYKNINFLAGTKRMKEALVRFRVENSWLGSNGLAGSDVKILKWDGSQWMQLETAQTTKDDTYTYYEAKTVSFSPFAISGLKGGVLPTATPAGVVTETQAMPTGTGTPSPSPTNKVPGFEFVLTIGILSVAYLFGRKRR